MGGFVFLSYFQFLRTFSRSSLVDFTVIFYCHSGDVIVICFILLDSVSSLFPAFVIVSEVGRRLCFSTLNTILECVKILSYIAERVSEKGGGSCVF